MTALTEAPRAAARCAHDLADDAPCGLASTAADGTLTRANATLLEWLGRPEQDVVGRLTFADLLTAGSRLVWLTHLVPRLAAEGRLSGISADLRSPDGGRLPVLLSARLTAVDGGAPVVRIAVSEAGERRAYEDSLLDSRTEAEAAERRIRALQALTEACASSTTTRELLLAVTAAAARTRGAVGAVLWLDGAAVQGLGGVTVGGVGAVTAASLDWDAVRGPVRATCDDDAVATVAGVDPRVGTGTAADAPAAPPWVGGAVDPGVRAVLAVPLLHGDERLGVLAVLLERAREVVPAELSVQRTIGSLVGQAVARTRLHAELRRQALHDGLTGLANRTLVTDRGEQALARTRRTGRSMAVLSIDLDGFKAVNDTWGHAAGDLLLTVIAQRLVAAVRDVDTVGRLGGDEFVVLCEDVTPTDAHALADRVRRTVEEPVLLDGATVRVGASVGVSLPDTDRTADVTALLSSADRAMYAAKRSARRTREAARPR